MMWLGADFDRSSSSPPLDEEKILDEVFEMRMEMEREMKMEVFV